MNKAIEQSKLLSSFVVFRELYNNNNDVFQVIAKFLTQLIISYSMRSFSLIEITNSLNKIYGFNIPQGVVKTALGRIKLRKSKGSYTANILNLKSKHKDLEANEKIKDTNDEIIRRLFDYAKERNQGGLTEKEKTEVKNSFESFLLTDTGGSDRWSPIISAFVLKQEKDADFKKQLSSIREGVILYSGIKYNTNLNEIGSWRTDLTIFIDTEILFHSAGFNGELYQQLWNDFFGYVKEVNLIHPDRIKLKYFKEVKRKIDHYFTSAKSIIKGESILNPESTAMKSILKGCKTIADVVGKKSDFDYKLKGAKILEDNFDNYFDERFRKYNIEDKETSEKLKKELDIKDPSENLKFLNFINIRRNGVNERDFENTRYILLSGKSKTIKASWNKNVKSPGCVPLATTLDFLTSKFWFKLGKGFGKGEKSPLIFDVITKAQIVLSTQVKESIRKEYDEAKKKFKNGEINEEKLKHRIFELRDKAKNPEEIKDTNVDDVLCSISEQEIENYTNEKEHLKIQLNEERDEKERFKKEALKEKERFKKETLKEKCKRFKEMEYRKSRIDKKVKKIMIVWRVLIGIVILGILYIILKPWITLNLFIKIAPLISQAISILYFIIVLFIITFIIGKPISFKEYKIFNKIFKGKLFNLFFKLPNYLSERLKRQEERMKEKKYKKSNFDILEFEKLEKEIQELKKS